MIVGKLVPFGKACVEDSYDNPFASDPLVMEQIGAGDHRYGRRLTLQRRLGRGFSHGILVPRCALCRFGSWFFRRIDAPLSYSLPTAREDRETSCCAGVSRAPTARIKPSS